VGGKKNPCFGRIKEVGEEHAHLGGTGSDGSEGSGEKKEIRVSSAGENNGGFKTSSASRKTKKMGIKRGKYKNAQGWLRRWEFGQNKKSQSKEKEWALDQ